MSLYFRSREGDGDGERLPDGDGDGDGDRDGDGDGGVRGTRNEHNKERCVQSQKTTAPHSALQYADAASLLVSQNVPIARRSCSCRLGEPMRLSPNGCRC